MGYQINLTFKSTPTEIALYNWLKTKNYQSAYIKSMLQICYDVEHEKEALQKNQSNTYNVSNNRETIISEVEQKVNEVEMDNVTEINSIDSGEWGLS